MSRESSHVVVLGAGFGGLTFCQTLRAAGTRITLVDRQNHHLFQPLLYQVAAAGLSAPDIAEPVLSILARRADVTVLLDAVTGVNLAATYKRGARIITGIEGRQRASGQC